MSKSKASALDQHAETLAAMDAEKKTLAEMVAWLKEEGCTVSPSTVSRYLEGLRSAELQSALLSQIAAGASQVKAVEAEFAKNPAPELDTIMRLQRVLVMKLSTQGFADPELLKLADQRQRV